MANCEKIILQEEVSVKIWKSNCTNSQSS